MLLPSAIHTAPHLPCPRWRCWSACAPSVLVLPPWLWVPAEAVVPVCECAGSSCTLIACESAPGVLALGVRVIRGGRTDAAATVRQVEGSISVAAEGGADDLVQFRIQVYRDRAAVAQQPAVRVGAADAVIWVADLQDLRAHVDAGEQASKSFFGAARFSTRLNPMSTCPSVAMVRPPKVG